MSDNSFLSASGFVFLDIALDYFIEIKRLCSEEGEKGGGAASEVVSEDKKVSESLLASCQKAPKIVLEAALYSLESEDTDIFLLRIRLLTKLVKIGFAHKEAKEVAARAWGLDFQSEVALLKQAFVQHSGSGGGGK